MVATVAAGTSAQYYLQQTEYYLGGSEPEGRWLLAGPGLGIVAGTIVTKTEFERLHAARDNHGRSLLPNAGGRTERVGAYDIAFSAPKSVSILWGLGDPELRAAIEHAQEEAVAAAFRLIDANAAFCRRGKGGRIREAVRLTVATFQHGESRPALHDDGLIFGDGNLHHHGCLLAIAQRADGSFGTPDGKAFFAWKMAAGAQYHLELSSRLQRLGFAVEHAGSNGLFEIAGVDRGLCRYFSARRREIEDELAAAGIASSADAPALAAAKARATRGAKQKAAADAKPEERHAFWQERAAACGFDPEQVVEAARRAGREHGRARTPEQTEALIRERVDAVPRTLTETQSLFEHRHLVAAVASALVGTGAGAGRAEVELTRLVEEGTVVALGRDGRWPHPIYSTPEVVALERDLRRMAQDLGRRRVTSAPDPVAADDRIRQAGLNPEQAEAARQAMSSAALQVIEGAPGVGKTHLLRPVSDRFSQAGWRVIGAATAWKVAHALRDDLGIEARAIDSWLAGAEHGRPFLTDKTVLVVDEAGLLSSRQLQRILSEVERARASGHEVALRLVGDRKQLQAIGGPGLRIVADAVGTTRVDTIVRQRESWAREVVTHLGRGHAAEALALLDAHGGIEDCAGPRATAAAMIAAWSATRAAQPDAPEPVLIARTNAQVLALNAGVREVLRREGALAPEDAVTLDAVTASGRAHRLGLAIGDRLRFLARLDAIGVVNGTEAILTGIEPTDPADPDAGLRLTARVGTREVSFSPEDLADERGRVRLASAHAITIYGCQGLTTETALVWADPGLDRHDAFVAASRARGTTRLFVDRAGLDAKVRAERSLTDRTRSVEPEERRATLARLLSRSGEKASTLDVIDAAGAVATQAGSRPIAVVAGSTPADPAAAASGRPTPAQTRTRRRKRELGLDG
ncbi:MobF family relaxase [Methylobacterium sp.]|uniref:MobF family relaxase n=1 Tax=Methylobacterium sp. TaxID=409 RepID=UPI003B001F4C